MKWQDIVFVLAFFVYWGSTKNFESLGIRSNSVIVIIKVIMFLIIAYGVLFDKIWFCRKD